ncbi:MAG: DUF1080 domain-containing protein [Bacteroidota bacterium]
MKSKLLFLVFIAAILGCNNSQAPVNEPPISEPPPPPIANTLTEAEQTEGWELLFDGQSTEKWRGYNKEGFPTQGWGVKDGEIQVFHSGNEEAGFGGDIITRDSFTDFILKVDFVLSDTSNSGIFYLIKEVPETPIWHNAPEYQLLDDETYRAMGGVTDAQMTGANYDMHPQKVNHSRPIGEWNTARIEKRGKDVKHFLNGELVIEYTLHDADWEARYQASKFKDYPGYAREEMAPIGLQDHGHLVRFRNLKIKRL